jgi:SOS-response transcriptional repressor LexA
MSRTATRLGKPTAAQKRVWRFIRDHQARRRIGCCYRQIARTFGWSGPNAAVGHCRALRAKGWVTWERGKPNTIIPTLESLKANAEQPGHRRGKPQQGGRRQQPGRNA